MLKLWRRSLAGQFIIVMLVALFISQAIGYILASGDRIRDLRASEETEFRRAAKALADALASATPEIAKRVTAASGTAYTRFWIADAPAPQPGAVCVPPGTAGSNPPGAFPEKPQADCTESSYIDGNGLGLAVPSGERWLNGIYYKRFSSGSLQRQSIISFVLSALVLAVGGGVFARRIARPLTALSDAADRLGRGEQRRPLPETGPDDLRKTAAAFNRMQARLHRFVSDRTQMLAAIGHDLRTPLTTLRLRAEYIKDTALQERIIATVDEMQSMVDATLAFAKGEATAGGTRTIDLNALVESLCEDMAAVYPDIAFAEGERLAFGCRPENLRRALRNLIENAVRYGGVARVSVAASDSEVRISIEDDGPGIPENQLEAVFSPFLRLEDSRNRQTGGVGLGLSIARAIAHQHGGDIHLSNRNPGLRAVLILPRENRDDVAA
ncbi:ATP-binding protein [Shinella sp.]|uniref:ATP-binding protein n=2 Tax=Shinella sp. TaxID=1870904 RepID=UPI004035EEBD